MRKVYKKLTDEQRKRGVCFSSTLSVCRTEQEGDIIHEIIGSYPLSEEQKEEVGRLLDDSFFNSSNVRYNIVRKG
jgi:hypothetical protein